MKLELQGSGFAPLALMLDRFSENVVDGRDIFDAMADAFASTQEQNFKSSGAVYGGWAPLSPRYAAWKAAAYPGAPILTREGHLRRSLTQRPLGVEDIAARRMVIGTDISYAGYHQKGTSKMPARPMINPPTGQELREYGSILHRFAFEGVA